MRVTEKTPKTMKLSPLQRSAIKVCRGILASMVKKGRTLESFSYIVERLLDVAVEMSQTSLEHYEVTLEAAEECCSLFGDTSGDNRAYTMSGILEALLHPADPVPGRPSTTPLSR